MVRLAAVLRHQVVTVRKLQDVECLLLGRDEEVSDLEYAPTSRYHRKGPRVAVR